MKYSKTHTAYYNDAGIEVPSATTILKILNKPTIAQWANYLGFKHLKYTDVLDDAASFGTMVHEMISCHIKGYVYIAAGCVCSKYELSRAFSVFLNWYENNDIETIFSEKQFTSDRYGGTVDFYGKVNGKYTIIDFKTSKKIRMSMFIQLALYTILLENHGYKVDQVGILLCNWKHKDIKIISREELDKYIELAKCLVTLFHMYYNLNESEWNDTII